MAVVIPPTCSVLVALIVGAVNVPVKIGFAILGLPTHSVNNSEELLIYH